jgi:Reverse transcriptase (RNA-dependent DNA polymerase)
VQNAVEQCVYYKWTGENLCIIGIYVDDLIILSDDVSYSDALQQQLCNCFQMSSLGPLSFILGLEIEKKANKMLIRQSQ